ncbi:MAG: glycogen synthase GlgA [Acetobacteraceae bacterium]|nr:glycogen synthase GlgA [Acetobacteraceae bacterium]
MTPLHVLSVVPEIYPLVKTGGLADVAGALPLALEAEGIRTTSLVPAYPAVLAAIGEPEAVHPLPDLFGGPMRLLRAKAAGLDVLALDAPHLYTRAGNPYVGPDGRDWADNPLRFAALARVAADVATGAVPDLRPDILHAHDWQAGLAPAYLTYRGGRRPGTVMTVHNLAFQGQVSPDLLEVLGLPPHSFSIAGVEYYGSIGYLKAGLALADRITTVSPSYAAEITTPEGGMGMDGLLRTRAQVLYGILNGIDDTVWDPATDPLIPSPFSITRLPRRAFNKSAVQARFGLHVSAETLLLGVVSRLTWQKGLDLLLATLPHLLALDAQLVVLGTGDRGLERAFTAAAAAHPGRVACITGYDEALAHQIQAGADALLVPSRFEPCGLTQLCALRYGALPVVARVGGLSDSIIDANEAALAAGTGSGIQFTPVTMEMLDAAIMRAAVLWRDQPTWRKLQRNAMKTDVSWRRPAARYAALYRALAAERDA